jgi:predicted NBD/HSP70 family sugar kinase
MLVRSGFPAGITGDFGHVLSSGGPRLCYCGKTGCIQTEITTQALLAQLQEVIRNNAHEGIGSFWRDREPTIADMIEAARQGDVLVLGLRSRFAHHLEIAVSGAVQLMSANMVIIGGQAIDFAGEAAVQAAQQAIQQLARLHPIYSKTAIVISTLSPNPATVGAAALITQAVFSGDITLASTASSDLN